ncbi:telomeric repeat-binding factor 2-interacting protein 1 isoform X2 [Chelmon rostratus]|uniref:telomeric repeat-binding factor 2-interacting protein 1 isoform X2 n=1 Tax=Chelmon rostratus TaxID=109905 RepID=UPI001BEA05CD|nr:telomeric repeat-binding factor 2-interacting protein 1 isoform X2 [Chelmon rostratus]
MSSKQQDVAKSDVSPVLFMAVNGEPMSFFLRPGPVKRKLQPLITAGGGMLCSVQQPGAILLIDPDERGCLAESTAHWYVSTQYIHDCIEKDEQLNLEDYRLNSEVVPRHSARLKNKGSSPGHLGGRVAYTTEDDAAILSYVREHKADTGGNRLWQEMEKQRVTSHSWQSMKHRYRARLAKKQSEAVEVATTEQDAKAAEGDTKVEGNEETDVENPSRTEDAVSPQMHATESDLTQIDQAIPAEHTQPEAQTSICSRREVQHVSPQTSKQPADDTQVETVEAETSDSPQPERVCLDPLTDASPIPAESTEPETDEPQTIISPRKESMPEAQPESLRDFSSQKKPREKLKSSPRLVQPQRRSTRRQLQLEDSTSPEPYGKTRRSSSSSAEHLSTSPHPSKKTKPALKAALQNDTTVDEPPSKKAKGKSAAESEQEESRQAAVSETTQADAESNAAPHKPEKKKEKRKLGILELATKEFEDESESDEDEAPDLQNPTETVTVPPTSTEPQLPSPDASTSTQASPEHGPGLQEKEPEAQASVRNCLPPTGCPEPSAAEPAAAKPAAVSAASKAHLFIFDSESQEEESQSIFVGNAAASANLQPTVKKDAAFSLTQVQLDEDKERITELMKETNQDLGSVTKALLKTSGDFSAALDLLLNPFSVSGPFWKRSDDGLLLSADPVVRQQLQERYGKNG